MRSRAAGFLPAISSVSQCIWVSGQKGKPQSDLDTKWNRTMLNYMTTWMQLKTDRRAVTALEYSLIASLFAVAIIAAVTLHGTSINATFTNIAGSL